MEWCEANGVCLVSSFYQHRGRGTWFSSIHRKYYELDRFIMKNVDRGRHVRKVNTMAEASISDLKPKRLRVDLKKRKWRVVRETKKVPRGRWERLHLEEMTWDYQEHMEVRMD